MIIGVDIGTTNTKTLAFTSDGRVVAQAAVTYIPVEAGAGLHELDPMVLFNAVLETMQQVIQQINVAVLQGVCFSSAMHSLMAVDATGEPLTNLITWADLRSKEQAERLKNSEAGTRIYQRTGTPVHPMSPLCKLMWMKETEPALFNAAHKFIGIKEFIFHRLFGKYRIDHSIASATGLFDIYTRDWCEEALQLAGVTPEKLSMPLPTTEIVRGLHPEHVQRLSIPADTPFIIGASDGCLAQLGSNALLPGEVTITIGTSGAVRMITHTPPPDPQQRIFHYILTDKLYVSGGPINNGGALLKWYTENFLQKELDSAEYFDHFFRESSTVPAGSEGLLFLPYVLGERAPVWDGYARGVFFGVDTRHTQAHMMRAVVEGINYALYQVAKSVEETIGPMQHIYASGGFVNSPHWLQWLANCFGSEIRTTASPEASATGAAILGLYATGALQNLADAQQLLQVQEIYYPNEEHHATYQRYYGIYASLYDRLKDAFHQLP